MSAVNIHFQREFSPEIQKIKNHKEFNEYRRQLERMDEIICLKGIDLQFASLYLAEIRGHKKKKMSAVSVRKKTEYAVRGFRCNILRHYLGMSYAKLSCRIAESPLLQEFIFAGRVDGEIMIPGRSLLHKYSQMISAPIMEEFVREKMKDIAGEGSCLGLRKVIDLSEIYVDACCLEAKIHFPVDWVLLRDSIRTLIKSILTIRRHGLVHRMGKPEEFISVINKECMAMAGSRKKKDSKKERKRILRRMKKIEKTVRKHGKRYMELLIERWRETDLLEDEAKRIVGRMKNVISKIPVAVKQAHDRIIAGKYAENADKILSLYDDGVNVVVRGKDGAEIEFGNTLFIAEQSDGLIVDWNLYKESAPADVKKLDESLNRLKTNGIGIRSVTGDRGFDSSAVRKTLAEDKIYNGICPRNPEELKKRRNEPEFLRSQKRRAQTEGRISILKNRFIGNPASGRSFEQRQMDVGWAVFSHNLWVVARMPEKEEQELLKTG